MAFYARSGDVIIMGGASRVCYHGVPRIVAERPPHLTLGQPEAAAVREAYNARVAGIVEAFGAGALGLTAGVDASVGEAEWADLLHYLATCRLNVNMRQVCCRVLH